MSAGRPNATERRVAAEHPLRRRILNELGSPSVLLTATDFAVSCGQSLSRCVYHLRVLADAGWVELTGPPEAPCAVMPVARRSELAAVREAHQQRVDGDGLR